MEQEKEISSSEGEEDKNYEDIPEYIPFKQRNLWKDITPIPPFKENPKIAPIQYSPKCMICIYIIYIYIYVCMYIYYPL